MLKYLLCLILGHVWMTDASYPVDICAGCWAEREKL